MDLHSEEIIPNNHNFIGHILYTPMPYWGQPQINWWIENHYIEGIRSFKKVCTLNMDGVRTRYVQDVGE